MGIEATFRDLSLAPAGEDGGYAQALPRGANLLARVPGGDPERAAQIVVIAAHYDHLGERDGRVYLGADDNASGVAVLLELSRRLAAAPPARSVLIAAFDAEEPPAYLGEAMGSIHWMAHPTVPRAQVVAMLAMDLMGGNLWPGARTPLYIMGRETIAATGEPASATGEVGLARRMMHLRLVEELPGARQPFSDHGAFFAAQIPVLLFSTGRSPHYHRVSDRPDTLDFEKLEGALTIVEAHLRWLADLPERPGWQTPQPVRAADLKCHGAMAVLLKDALAPNLVQTLEHTPALLHGGPFANIAHGCNSLIATRTALKLADYVVTEAGFGADLGAEKFIDIKCRISGLRPACAVLVATVRALKFHGGVALADLQAEDLPALRRGLVNLERHLHNLRDVFGLPCVVAVNHFGGDTEAEHALLRDELARLGAAVITARHWAEGGRGAMELAREVVRLCELPDTLRFAYDDAAPLWDKMQAVARRIYGAADVSAPATVRAQVERLQASGYGHLPVCVAKTQYSFATDPTLRGAPAGHTVSVREVRLAAGAEFVVMICGDVMTMPGLPKVPSAEHIDIDEAGRIVGLS